jgi:hypothetical protein
MAVGFHLDLVRHIITIILIIIPAFSIPLTVGEVITVEGFMITDIHITDMVIGTTLILGDIIPAG